MNPPPSKHLSDAELLNALRESALDELRYFSNSKREERERWVVAEFLTRQNLAFDKGELHSQEQHSKTDVKFRDARFQIKEIMNPGVKRHKDAKIKYERIQKANSIREIMWPSTGYDIPGVDRIYNLVTKEAYSLSIDRRYTTIKADLDLLFYVTRTYAALIQKEETDHEYLSSIGWRSISCLAGRQSIVLFASSNAPEFLRS